MKHCGTTTLRNDSCKIVYLHIALMKTYKYTSGSYVRIIRDILKTQFDFISF